MTPVTRRRFAVPEGARNAFIDLLLEHWPRIASVAWDGWLAHARGGGTVPRGEGIVPRVLACRRGAPCPGCAGVIGAYDPETRAVVAVVRNGGRVGWLQTLGGEPTPAASEPFPPAAGEVTVH